MSLDCETSFLAGLLPLGEFLPFAFQAKID